MLSSRGRLRAPDDAAPGNQRPERAILVPEVASGEGHGLVSETTEWAIPEPAQPKAAECAFDLDRALSAVLSLRSEIPEDAFTASILGTERAGNGVMIREDGLVLTIGYLITEAETIWLTANSGAAAPAHVVGYDPASGFGLVQALGRLGVPALEVGTSARSKIGDSVIIAGGGGLAHALKARVASRREFAGYWEYVLDEALFTVPPHPSWGGAACIGGDGRLAGIGSLFVQEARGEGIASQGNMIVPIELLGPILDDLLRFGRVDRPPRPWLGLYASEAEGTVFIAGLAEGGPAHRAGVHPGDVVLEVGGAPVSDLAGTFRSVWQLGPAGAEIPLMVMRDGAPREIRIPSADRSAFLKKPRLH
jgi:S1-C subfamily serine protease